MPARRHWHAPPECLPDKNIRKFENIDQYVGKLLKRYSLAARFRFVIFVCFWLAQFFSYFVYDGSKQGSTQK